MFAAFMDYVLYPIVWLVSPKMREHQRYVKIQNDHLDGVLHPTPDPNCDYCKAGEEWRKRRADLG